MAGETGLEPVMSESKSDVFPVTPFPNNNPRMVRIVKRRVRVFIIVGFNSSDNHN